MEVFLKVKPKTHRYLHVSRYYYLSTADGCLYTLDQGNVKRFLAEYVHQIVDSNSHPHLNFKLYACKEHILCIEGKTSTNNASPEDLLENAKLLYAEVVTEIRNEMMISRYGNLDTTVFYAFLLARPGAPEFQLIFPRIYLNRCHYAMMMTRVGQWMIKKVEAMHNLVMYRSCQKISNGVFQVVALFTRDCVWKGPEMEAMTRGGYPKKSLDWIYSHLFFPVHLQGFKTDCIISYPIWITQKLLPAPAYQLLSYREGQTQTYLYGVGKSQPPTNGRLWIESLFDWCKTHRHTYSFSYLNWALKSYMDKTYPPRYKKCSSNVKGIESAVRSLDPAWKRLYLSLHQECTVEQFTAFMNYESQLYEPELIEYLLGKQPSSCYTHHSLSYQLAYRHGISLDSFNEIYVSKKLLDILDTIYQADSVTDFCLHLVLILQTIPYGVHNQKIHLFDWATHEWKITMPVNQFARLFTTALVDNMLGEMTDPIVKHDCEEQRNRYIRTSQQSIELVLVKEDNLAFDTNPHILGLPNGMVIPATGPTRTAIPQDRVWKRIIDFGFEYADPHLFAAFWNREAYLSAFQRLKIHLSSDPCLENFRETQHEAIDHLLGYLCLFFGEKYEDLVMLLSFLANALMGRFESTRILFLLGEPSRGQNILAGLCHRIFGRYSGTLTQDLLYHSSSKSKTGDRAMSNITRDAGCRLWIVENLSSTQQLNTSLFHTLTSSTRSSKYPEIPHLLFTMTTYPILGSDPALLQQLQMLTCQSTFLSSVSSYDFTKRIFPSHPDLNERITSPFTSLIIHAMRLNQGVTGR